MKSNQILPIEQESQDEHARAAGFQLSGSQINSTCILIKKHVPAVHMGHICTRVSFPLSFFSFYCKYTQISIILYTSEYFTCLRKLLPISACCVCLTLPGCSPASPCQRCHWVFFWPGYLHALQDAGSSLCRPASLDVQSVQTHP